jgi:hypothetical protein
MNNKTALLHRKIRLTTAVFMVTLALSGITAIPVKTEISWLLEVIPKSWSVIHTWLSYILDCLNSSSDTLLYGYDWLAFAHIVIALNFIGVLKDPVRNSWVIDFGMISCILVIPFTFLMGTIRGIPFWWQLIDCSFGLIGFIPLYFIKKWTSQLQHNKYPDLCKSSPLYPIS